MAIWQSGHFPEYHVSSPKVSFKDNFFLNEPVSKQGIAKKFIVLLIELAYIYKLLVNHRQIIDHFEMKKFPN